MPDDALSKHLVTTAAGSGTLKVASWKNGQEVASGGLNLSIIDKPELILGKNNLLPERNDHSEPCIRPAAPCPPTPRSGRRQTRDPIR